jgi:glycosyltransferase involved in cell wall biosynthesis
LVSGIMACAPEGPIVWQYVPHMYGRGGVNFALAGVLEQLRRAGRRQLIIAHEIAAPISFWPQRFFYAMAQRRQWKRLVQIADAIGISTEIWLEKQKQRLPEFAEKFFLAPSPSNIPFRSCSFGALTDWKKKKQIPYEAQVLGFFGETSAPKQFEWVLAAWEKALSARLQVALVLAGADAMPPQAGSHQWLRPLGFLPADEVSIALQSMHVLALPFVDGVSERRGSFMAGLSHGCAIVGTLGESTGPTLRRHECYLAADSRQGFVRNVLELLQEPAQQKQLKSAALAQYRARYDWPRLITAIRERLSF